MYALNVKFGVLSAVGIFGLYLIYQFGLYLIYQNCVIRAAYENMTLQECHEVVLYFQKKGFEATWYQKDNKKPVIVVSWGLPFDIDEIDNIYKFNIEIAAKDKDVNKVVRLLSEYICIQKKDRKN